MSTPDPLSMLYAELWTALEQHPGTAAIKQGNRVRFDADSKAHARVRDVVQAADLPELLLTYESIGGALRSSSSSTTFDVQWGWVLTTGDMRLDEVLFPLSWMILEAMVRWHATLTALEWGGTKFVKKVDFVQGRAGESEALRRANIRGWSTLLSFRTTLIVTTAAMVANATPVIEE